MPPPSRRFWAFSGLDGAGKSTQIDLLIDALNSAGGHGCRVWARGGYTPGFSALKKWARALRLPGIPQVAGRTPERRRGLRPGRLRKAWLTLAIIDLALYYGVWVRFLRARGWNVIADRYIVDTEIDFLLSFPEERILEWRLWRALRRFAPQADRHFVMLIPVEESLRRSTLKKEPFPDDEATLALRLRHYQQAVVQSDALQLDGMQEPLDLQRLVLEHCGLGVPPKGA